MVFLDVDLDRVWDEEDPMEPMAWTGRDSTIELAIPEEYDLDANGQIDPCEGIMVAQGGLQLSTVQPLWMSLIAPVGAGVITPLTTLLTTLTLEQGYTVSEAAEEVAGILGLPQIDLLNFDPIGATAAGEMNGPAVLSEHVKVFSTQFGISTLLANRAGISLEASGMAVMSALAERVVTSAEPLDLTDPMVLGELIERSAASFGVTPEEEVVSAAAQILSEANQAINGVTPQANVGYVDAIT